jgi:hypothetical protein
MFKHFFNHNSYFIRNKGWNGGDGSYSLPLPDGRALWSLKDTKTLIPYKGTEESEHWYWPLDATSG